jgi:flagellin
MTVINSNSAAMLTANSINQNDRAMTSTMERLSTGKRINSAADDAAGLAIATKMTAQIRGLDQAGRNANNATSMVQLADGAAEQISNILQRMREIVVQGADGSNSVSDVAVLNVEFKEAASEIDRIVDVTEFNGKKLLNGSAGDSSSTVQFQVGANAGQTLSVDFADFNLNAGSGAVAATPGSTSTVTGSAAGGATAAANLDAKIQNLIASGVGITDGVTTISVDLQDVQAAANDPTITAATVTKTQFIAAINNVGSQSPTFAFTASDGGTGVINFDTTSGREGTATKLETALSADAAITDAYTAGLVGGTAGDGANPMATDLSAFISTGMQASVSVDGVAAATFDNTLNALDKAIEGVATQRATFGATMNRLEYAVDNLASSSLATATARGRIEDANYATETTSLARSQIIAQAGTAMLAQANQKSQSVLSLLQ